MVESSTNGADTDFALSALVNGYDMPLLFLLHSL